MFNWIFLLSCHHERPIQEGKFYLKFRLLVENIFVSIEKTNFRLPWLEESVLGISIKSIFTTRNSGYILHHILIFLVYSGPETYITKYI